MIDKLHGDQNKARNTFHWFPLGLFLTLLGGCFTMPLFFFIWKYFGNFFLPLKVFFYQSWMTAMKKNTLRLAKKTFEKNLKNIQKMLVISYKHLSIKTRLYVIPIPSCNFASLLCYLVQTPLFFIVTWSCHPCEVYSPICFSHGSHRSWAGAGFHKV